MKRIDLIVVSAALMLVGYTFALSAASQVSASLQGPPKTIANSGSVMAIGVGVYWDSECTSSVGSIDWGVIEPGTTKDITCYIRNEGNSVATLTLSTSNWNPPEATTYMDLVWDYVGQPINPDGVVQVTFTLSLSASVQDITDYSFTITIFASS